MKSAVIKTGGKQYLVTEGSYITIEKIDGVNKGDTVTFDQVLLTDSGSTTEVGMPTLSGKVVSGTVLDAVRDDKKIVVKYKAKSRYHKKRGHRQPVLKVKINAL